MAGPCRVAATTAVLLTVKPENRWYSAKLPMCRMLRRIQRVAEKSTWLPSEEPRCGAGVKKLKNSTDNPMQPTNLAKAPRCGARTRSGTECRSPAVRGKQRCRMHGGNSSGAPKGNRNAWKHGDRSAQAEAELKMVREADRTLRLLAKIRKGMTLRPDERGRLIVLMKK